MSFDESKSSLDELNSSLDELKNSLDKSKMSLIEPEITLDEQKSALNGQERPGNGQERSIAPPKKSLSRKKTPSHQGVAIFGGPGTLPQRMATPEGGIPLGANCQGAGSSIESGAGRASGELSHAAASAKHHHATSLRAARLE